MSVSVAVCSCVARAGVRACVRAGYYCYEALACRGCFERAAGRGAGGCCWVKGWMAAARCTSPECDPAEWALLQIVESESDGRKAAQG